MAIWYTLPDRLPLNNETVWVRLNYWFGKPFKAIWNLANQEFVSLDNTLTYPLWSISRYQPLTPYVDKILGYTSVYTDRTTNDTMRAMQITTTELSRIKSLTIYHVSGSGNAILGIYSNGADSRPATRLAKSASTPINASEDWQTFNLESSIDIAANTIIWMAFVFQSNPGLAYQFGSPGRASADTPYSSGLTDPFGPSAIASYVYSVYLTYEAPQ